MFLGQRYDRSHCYICDIKKDLEPETSSLPLPLTAGERKGFLFSLWRCLGHRGLFCVGMDSTHSSHLAPGQWRRKENKKLDPDSHSLVTTQSPGAGWHWNITLSQSQSPTSEYRIPLHRRDRETDGSQSGNLTDMSIIRLKELHNCFQWMERNKPRTWIFWER